MLKSIPQIMAAMLGLLAPSAMAQPVEARFAQGEDGRLYVDVQLSGRPLTALIDTGFTAPLMLVPEAAERVSLRYIPFLRTARARGVDGVGRRGRLAAVKITDLGGAAGDWDIPAVVLDSPILLSDAILGMGFLADYDATFDFRAGRLTLAQPDPGLPVPGGLANCHPGKPAFSLEDWCGRSAIYIDTGAEGTVMNAAMAATLGVPPGSGVEQRVLRGASGGTIPAIRYDFPVSVRGVELTSFLVADFPGRGGCRDACPELILGMDTLGRLSSLRITRSSIVIGDPFASGSSER